MSDLERVLSEAQAARDEAEAALKRADELAGRADAARQQAQEEEVARRRQWAQRLVDSYDAEISAADAGIQEGEERFRSVAVENIGGAVEAYVAWSEASLRHYGLQIRIAAAADILGHQVTQPELVALPRFSDALDDALAAAVVARAAAARQEVEAELTRLREPASGTGSA